MKIQFDIRGMHCSACAASIERAVRKLDGADQVYVERDGKKLMYADLVKEVETKS